MYTYGDLKKSSEHIWIDFYARIFDTLLYIEISSEKNVTENQIIVKKIHQRNDFSDKKEYFITGTANIPS